MELTHIIRMAQRIGASDCARASLALIVALALTACDPSPASRALKAADAAANPHLSDPVTEQFPETEDAVADDSGTAEPLDAHEPARRRFVFIHRLERSAKRADLGEAGALACVQGPHPTSAGMGRSERHRMMSGWIPISLSALTEC